MDNGIFPALVLVHAMGSWPHQTHCHWRHSIFCAIGFYEIRDFHCVCELWEGLWVFFLSRPIRWKGCEMFLVFAWECASGWSYLVTDDLISAFVCAVFFFLSRLSANWNWYCTRIACASPNRTAFGHDACMTGESTFIRSWDVGNKKSLDVLWNRSHELCNIIFLL